MKIQLIGELESDLISLGLKAGDTINATPDTVSKRGAMQFSTIKHGNNYNCTVWPENYLIPETPKPDTI